MNTTRLLCNIAMMELTTKSIVAHYGHVSLAILY